MRECFDRHNCDKGSRHGYERVYEPIFADRREEPLRLLEVGILRGASIEAWVDYFPNAEIVGIDTFGRVHADEIPILEHPRVDWYCCDSTEPAHLYGRFDFVIDDGLHTHTAQRKTFENLMPLVDSAYFIEDVWPLDHMTDAEKQHKWLKRPGYSDVEYQMLLDSIMPWQTEFHDLRDGYQPDSFIVQVSR
jgi:hypothetical protein